MKQALALDMDDLIYPFMQLLVPFHNERYGTDLSIDQYSTFWFEDLWETDSSEAIRRVDQCFLEVEQRGERPDPLRGASNAVPLLAERYRLYIVTSRPDEFHARTADWLDHHFQHAFDGMFLCNSYVGDGRESKRTKASVVEELDAVGLVDDSASHIREVAEHGRLGVLFGDYAWNRHHDIPANAVRASTWDEVLRILLKEN